MSPAQRYWILTGLCLACTVWMAVMGRHLETAAAPLGIVSFELAGTAQRSAAILSSWSPTAQKIAMLIQGVDVLYLLVYSTWLWATVGWIANRLDRTLGRTRMFGRLVARGALLAAAFDWVENHALVEQLLYGADDGWAAIAHGCAVVKFALVGAALLFILVAGPLALRRSRASEPK